MDSNPPTSADIANSVASDAARSADDLKVLLGWALERISELEVRVGVVPSAQPETPSERSRRLLTQHYASTAQYYASYPSWMR